jgi:hypothetical protein
LIKIGRKLFYKQRKTGIHKFKKGELASKLYGIGTQKFVI